MQVIHIVYYVVRESHKNIMLYTQEPKLAQVVNALPYSLREYHIRFKALCQEVEPKIHAWIDISNPNASVPMIDNTIYVKLLPIKSLEHSRISKRLLEVMSNNANGRNKQAVIIQQPIQVQSIQQQLPQQQPILKQNTQEEQNTKIQQANKVPQVVVQPTYQPQNQFWGKLNDVSPQKEIQINKTPPPQHGFAYEQQQKQLDSLLDVDDYSPDIRPTNSNNNLDINVNPIQVRASNNDLWVHDDIQPVNQQDRPTSQQNLWPDSNQFSVQPMQIQSTFAQQVQNLPARKSNNDLWSSDDDVNQQQTQEIDPNSANYREQLRKKVQDEIDQRVQNKVDEFNQNLEQDKIYNEQRQLAKDELDPKLTAWAFKDGARQNLRNLLSTMNSVLWEGAEWKCSISDLLSDGKVKAKYMQAIRLTHPDKNKQAEPRQRYTAERVFFELNQAWNSSK